MYIHRALQYSQNVLTEFSYLLINFWHLSSTFKLRNEQRKYPSCRCNCSCNCCCHSCKNIAVAAICNSFAPCTSCRATSDRSKVNAKFLSAVNWFNLQNQQRGTINLFRCCVLKLFTFLPKEQSCTKIVLQPGQARTRCAAPTTCRLI